MSNQQVINAISRPAATTLSKVRRALSLGTMAKAPERVVVFVPQFGPSTTKLDPSIRLAGAER